MKKISIVIPVYNKELYLNQCVDSICRQSYKNLEIILVDDGSNQQCARMCDDCLQKDSRIKVIHKENGGALSARREGIYAATGDYVTFVDADDWIEPQLCEEYAKWIMYEPDVIASTNYYRNYANGDEREVFHNSKEGYWKYDEFEKEVLEGFVSTSEFYSTEFPITMCTYAFKIQKARYFIEKIDEDIINGEVLAYVIAAFFNAESFAATSYRGYHYRLNKKSKVSTMTNAKEKYRVTYEWINKQIEKSRYDHEMLYRKNDVLLYQHLMNADYVSVLQASKEFLYPYTKVKAGSTIIIYGFGMQGKQLAKSLQEFPDYKVTAIADTNYKAYEQDEYNVIPPEGISKYKYDYIVIAVSYVNMRKEIKKKLYELGVDESKIAEPDINVMDGKLIYK